MTVDFGVFKRAAAEPVTTIVLTRTSTSASAHTSMPSSTAGATLPSTTAIAGSVASQDLPNDDSDWWNRHYKWVIMLIALFVGLTLFALLAVWLKRRHDRKADQINNGFNAGITSRSTPKLAMHPAAGPSKGTLYTVTDLEPGSGRDSPARSRNAFMPYGYGYSRSESRLASPPPAPESAGEVRRSPLARVQTPLDDIQKVNVSSSTRPMQQTGSPDWSGRKVQVRERGAGA